MKVAEERSENDSATRVSSFAYPSRLEEPGEAVWESDERRMDGAWGISLMPDGDPPPLMLWGADEES